MTSPPIKSLKFSLTFNIYAAQIVEFCGYCPSTVHWSVREGSLLRPFSQWIKPQTGPCWEISQFSWSCWHLLPCGPLSRLSSLSSTIGFIACRWVLVLRWVSSPWSWQHSRLSFVQHWRERLYSHSLSSVRLLGFLFCTLYMLFRARVYGFCWKFRSDIQIRQ